MAVRMPAAIQVPRHRLQAKLAERKLMARGSAAHERPCVDAFEWVWLGIAQPLGLFTRKG